MSKHYLKNKGFDFNTNIKMKVKNLTLDIYKKMILKKELHIYLTTYKYSFYLYILNIIFIIILIIIYLTTKNLVGFL